MIWNAWEGQSFIIGLQGTKEVINLCRFVKGDDLLLFFPVLIGCLLRCTPTHQDSSRTVIIGCHPFYIIFYLCFCLKSFLHCYGRYIFQQIQIDIGKLLLS